MHHPDADSMAHDHHIEDVLCCDNDPHLAGTQWNGQPRVTSLPPPYLSMAFPGPPEAIFKHNGPFTTLLKVPTL